MCGIAGFLQFRPGDEQALLRQATDMANAIVHRGPDAGDAWADAGAGLAMASRRLAVVDLSQAGAQPMCSQSGRFVISYNGEIYNAAEVRPELEAKGIRFRGHSDTEVLLEACAAWGVRTAVDRFIGMFAFALWDRHARVLFLVRDRLGKKPLYWGQFGELLLYGSELKALRQHAGWEASIDNEAMAAFLRFGYVPAPRSIYRGIQKLPPGAILEVDQKGAVKLETYWALSEQVLNGQKKPRQLSDEDAEQELAQLLDDAVGRRMIADVPLGAFLSGGIDSSTVVALMQARSSRPVRTFSVGFSEPEFDEAPHARAVARHFGTDHTELYVSPDQARDVIPRLPDIYDEPFADSSQIPTFLVCELARRHVTVALSGDGGDELFSGYDRYARAQRIRTWLHVAPRPLRAFGARAIRSVPLATWDGLSSLVPARWRLERAGDRMHKLADLLPGDENTIYRGLVSQWQNPSELLAAGNEPSDLFQSDAVRSLVPDYGARMQYLDVLTYLPDDILVKLDRASMAVSLEARVPLIDHRIVAFCWSLPRHMFNRGGTTKWLLRRVLRRFVRDELVDRPKMGFGVPIGAWLRGPLREWAEHLLSPRALQATGLDPAPVRTRWASHLSGAQNWQYPLWTVLMLQAWTERYAGNVTGSHRDVVAQRASRARP